MNKKDNPVSVNIDLDSIKSHTDYKACWDNLDRLELRLVRKDGECRHKEEDVFYYESPYLRPQGVCAALLHVVDLYIWRAVVGFPSWNSEDHRVFRLHCPDAEGTIWELRRVPKEN